MPKKPHILTGSGLWNMLVFLTDNRVEKKFWHKIPELIFWNALLLPLQVFEKIFYGPILKKINIHPQPVFIIGHWRSGTTFLHYLLSRDKQFGYCSNIDAFAPVANIAGRSIIRKILQWRLPSIRPMDDVKLYADAPQEEEFSLMLLSPYSFYHSFVFPQNVKKYFYQYGLFANENATLMHRWTKLYFSFLQKLTFLNKRKRLLLKNPVNTLRIKQLVNMFPEARFIYLFRNSAEVKASTLRMITSLMDIHALQEYDESVLIKQINEFHYEVLKQFETQRNFVTPENLVKISYDDLTTDPLKAVRRIYTGLGLEGFERSKSDFEKFIEEEKDYRPYAFRK